MSQDPSQLNSAQVLSFLRRRGLWIIGCALIAAVAAVGYSKQEAKRYTATASVVFNNDQLSEAIAGLPSTSAGNSLLQQSDNLELLHLDDLDEKTAAALGSGLTPQKVSEAITVSGAPESSIATVSAVSSSPTVAADIANAYASQFVKDQATAEAHYYEAALALVRKQIASLSPKQRVGTDGLELQDREQSLALLAGLQPNTVEVSEHALAPTAPSSPKTSRNVLVGLLLGLTLGFGIALLRERTDPRLTTATQLAAAVDAPLVGVLPQTSAVTRPLQSGDVDAAVLSPTDAESFHLLRARLRSLSSDREVRTVLITSAGPDEGKTAVAIHLAGAAARMGARVLLIEADLPRPELARTLGIDSEFGLPEVLSGTAAISDATRSLSPDGADGSGRNLDVLLAGPHVPANRVALIESRAMTELLHDARSQYDFVVVDSPELGVVSDAFLLVPKVDAVVLVGRLRRIRGDVATHAGQALRQSRAQLVGVVAVGADSGNLQSAVPSPPHRSQASTATSIASDLAAGSDLASSVKA